MIYDTAFGIVLPDQHLPCVLTAVSHYHALALYLENLPDISKIKGKKFEVYEWLQPFKSRKIIVVKGSFLFAVKMGHLSTQSRIDFIANRIL